MLLLPPLLPFFFFLLLFPPPALTASSSSSSSSPLAFKNAIPDSNLTLHAWTPDGNCCSWPGVACQLLDPGAAAAALSSQPQASDDDDSSAAAASFAGLLASSAVRVTRLSLPSLRLAAQIPPVLGNLSALRHLNLSGNLFWGSFPAALASSLLDLRTLDLSSNNLSGSVSFLDRLPALQFVNVSDNAFSGGLPSYRNLSNLEAFYASKNALSGTPAADVCLYAPNISVLDLSSNNLNGTLRPGLGLCRHLQELYMGLNTLTGPIPDDLYNATSLLILSLEGNSFTGPLKDSVGSLANLTKLLLCSNNLSGELPRSLSRNSKLTALLLGNNQFTGTLDVDFSNMTNLEEVDLNTNAFFGSLPWSLANCAFLRVLNFAKNKLSGEIPREFNSLKNLTTVSLSTNRLNGSLSSLANCENLVSLVLTKNFFTEPLPSSITGFRNLQVLALGFLNLSGRIPDWLQNCTKLQILDLSWNHLDGELPNWLGSFQHLVFLELSNNSFTGMIPLPLFSMMSMMHNDTNMTGMQTIDSPLTVKRQTHSPDLMYNDANALPPSLYLSNNRLSGGIPSEIGQLKAVVHLDLSYNSLTGNIPESLANVRGLELLDLSNNDLNGPIPASLTSLTFLAGFNVSYNNLSGRIPLGNQFATFSSFSYEGNSGLCGYPLPDCMGDSMGNGSHHVHSTRRKTRMIALLVSVCFVIGGAMLLAVAFFCMLSGRTAVHQGLESSREMRAFESLFEARNACVELFHNHWKLTVGDLFKATNNFDSANIIGCGGFGLVYRADLCDGSRLAIKKLTGDCGQMEREFRAEVDALSKAQHRNLVSLQGYFHIGNDKLLIYTYMENGSLDYWLHEKSDGGVRLDWPTRLKIAQGAAAGLAYLHQSCNPHIVHRDIKSSNILLDERFEAHLADFGLARLMMPTDTHVTTELVGTLGYIPPEYSEALNATPRGDIYSLGVVLLELLTGKRPVDVCKPREAGDLVAWVQQLRRDSQPDQIFDQFLQCKKFEVQMLQVLDVACLCIDRNPLKRPTIKDVVFWLDEVGQDKTSIK